MAVIGIDIGTGSAKAVLASTSGVVLATAQVKHVTSSPQPGWFEHDALSVWWDNVVRLCRDLLAAGAEPVEAVCVSGIGPALLLTDAQDRPVRPAILYGIDTRAETEIAEMTASLGAERLARHCGNPLSTQSIGPKLAWVARHEPGAWSAAKYWYGASSWIVRRLTGEYVLDHYSASACDPLYDLTSRTWWERGWAGFENLARPRLAWSGDVVGTITASAATQTGVPAGTPVLAGTIDAMAEAYSAGCRSTGDTMLMYGSTMFIIEVVDEPFVDPGLWTLVGIDPGHYSLAAGMATAGLITDWFGSLTGTAYRELAEAAATVPAGSRGLLLLPYFAGERTPILDPRARGTWFGLTTRHGKAEMYRSILEAVGFGIRHNLAAMRRAGAPTPRLVAVGGGTQAREWLQITSDVVGEHQEVPRVALGASYGDAMLAAQALGADTSRWVEIAEVVEPAAGRAVYDDLFATYVDSYTATLDITHRLSP